MDEFNALVELVKGATPVIQSGISALVGGFITAMFLRGNTRREEFEKIKLGKIKEAIDDLVDSRELTLTELVKCKNLIEIAEKADTLMQDNKESFNNQDEYYDFDWFLRFFEAAGNVSNEDMQSLWARILAGEVQKKGSFSFRAIETLKNLSKYEAEVLEYCSRIRITSPYNEVFLLSSEESFSISDDEERKEEYSVTNESDWIEILSYSYYINHDKITTLEQCGILSSVLVTSIFEISKNPIYIFNDFAVIEISLKDNCKYESIEFELKGFRFNNTALELFQIINEECSLKYVLDIGRLIEHYNSSFNVKVFKVTDICEDGVISFDDEFDYLHSEKYCGATELPNLKKLDAMLNDETACQW